MAKKRYNPFELYSKNDVKDSTIAHEVDGSSLVDVSPTQRHTSGEKLGSPSKETPVRHIIIVVLILLLSVMITLLLVPG